MTDPIGPWVLRVVTSERISPDVVRVTLGGGLDGFTPKGPDQQVKLFFPRPGLDVSEVPQPPEGGDVMTWYQSYLAIPEARRPWMRTYSVRRLHLDRGEIEIDFVLHGHGEDAGPASRWADAVGVGDEIAMVGPGVSHYRVPADGAAMLFVGDETALPAIGAWLEALPTGVRAVVLAEVADEAGEVDLPSAADVTVRWLHRDGVERGHSTVLVDAVKSAELPAGPLFAWVAGEASMVRAVRRHLVDHGVPKKQIAFSGYWRLHLAQDAGPTPEEADDQAEMVADL